MVLSALREADLTRGAGNLVFGKRLPDRLSADQPVQRELRLAAMREVFEEAGIFWPMITPASHSARHAIPRFGRRWTAGRSHFSR